MKIEINPADGVRSSDAVEQHVRSKLAGLERRFGDRITVVKVYLKDINAGKGGIDKVCTLEAHPAGMRPVVAEATDADVYTAVHRASRKLEKAMAHRVGRSEARNG